MQVKDLQARQGNVDIELEVIEKQPVREFNKFGKPGKVANAIGKDETGTVKITLWNEQTEQVEAGDKIRFTNAYVGEWQGELQLSTGKFGTLDVTKGAASPEQETTMQGEDNKDPDDGIPAVDSDVKEETIE